MFEQKILNFPQRAILTYEMLAELRDYPHNFLDLFYKDFSDGIISGLDIFEDSKNIFLGEGILKYDGKFYFLKEKVNLSELAAKEKLEAKQYNFVLKETIGDTFYKGVKLNTLEIVLSESEGFCLGSFSGDRNTIGNLPNIKADDLFKEFTQRSSLYLLNIAYAAKGESTFHPFVFRAILEKLRQKQNKTIADFTMLFALENEGVVSMNAVRTYIRENGVALNSDSRKDIFEALNNALKAEFKIASYAIETKLPENKARKPKEEPMEIYN